MWSAIRHKLLNRYSISWTSYLTNSIKLQNGLKHKTISIRPTTINIPQTIPLNITRRNEKTVGYWLLTCSGLVFVAVALGGLTRLTESGLSMVNWKLLGEKLPTSNDQWISEFQKYQQYPEFKMKNHEITLNEFKWIWYMEFAHRMWGRLIGGAFLLPTIYFWSKNMLTSPKIKTKIGLLGSLILIQGLMGWYMVKSGLDESNFQGVNDIPRVSQYRLAAHLGLALILYTGLLQTSLKLLDVNVPRNMMSSKVIASWIRFSSTTGIKALILLTAISGAFVAGLDAGLTYNSFPKMADKWIPNDMWAITSPSIWRNFTENPTMVQFNHRILGITTFTGSSLLWLLLRNAALVNPRIRTASITVGAVALLQAVLGISTLLTYVPISLAASHQANSLVLLSTAIWLSHEIKKLPK